MTSPINCSETATLCQAGEALLIDVRTPAEYGQAHVEGSINAPLGDLNRLGDDLEKLAAGRRVVLVCRTGRRAKDAAALLDTKQKLDTVVLDGGVASWSAEGRPLIEGKTGMSLERQVRIAAGFLVVLGISLGYALHPAFYGLSAFVGCGLMFAGITDTCGMAMVLAKLPFNRVRELGCGVEGRVPS